MHTFEGKTCRIHYNSDLSGEIAISTSATDDPKDISPVIEIAGADIKEFMRQYIESVKITALEDAPFEKLIGL
jgi:hypothetical protein